MQGQPVIGCSKAKADAAPSNYVQVQVDGWISSVRRASQAFLLHVQPLSPQREPGSPSRTCTEGRCSRTEQKTRFKKIQLTRHPERQEAKVRVFREWYGGRPLRDKEDPRQSAVQGHSGQWAAPVSGQDRLGRATCLSRVCPDNRVIHGSCLGAFLAD